MRDDHQAEFDLAIVGAGPVGLTLANIVGQAGLRVVVVEQLPALIDYPRGVGMDDECLRTFQSIGLADAVSRHTTPHQSMEFRAASGRTLALIKPQTTVFGWPRRNAFIQPLVDKVLYEGVGRYPNVVVSFGTELRSLRQDEQGVTIRVVGEAGAERALRCRYLCGCDGGRSLVRKSADIPFRGQTEATRWIVVDLEDDPVGVPNTILYCDPSRPFVSIALPHAVRRLEFMVMPGETEEDLTGESGLHRLLGRILPHPDRARVIRSRVYTHHSRIADTFRNSRILIAGDAAHLMPVWQGQGYNSGIRDASNLGWKLVEVLRGRSDDRLLDSYTAERRQHARAMIRLSTTAGRIFSPTNRAMAVLRDWLFSAMKYLPPVRDYIVQMRFKPIPVYEDGVVVRSGGGAHVVGTLFPQPAVGRADGTVSLLDDVIGNHFAILSWAVDPQSCMSGETRATWQRLGGRVIVVRPATECGYRGATSQADEIVADHTLALKDWFSGKRISTVVLRPDRFIAAAGGPQEIDDMVRGLSGVLCTTTTRDGPP